MTSETLHLTLTDRARRAQHASHLTPAVMLIVLGVQELMGGEREHLWLDLLGIVLGFALLIAFKREFGRKGGHSHSRVGWFDVLAGMVIALEGYHKLHPGRWFQPGTVLMIVGAVIMLIGFQHHRLPQLRRVICTDEGFSIRTRPFVWLTMRWRDVAGIELEGNRLMIGQENGSHRSINLRRIANRDQVLEMVKRQWEEHQPQEAVL
jgi:hypothetical protein